MLVLYFRWGLGAFLKLTIKYISKMLYLGLGAFLKLTIKYISKMLYLVKVV